MKKCPSNKIRYPNLHSTKMEVERLNKLNYYNGSAKMVHPYYCTICLGFHIGSSNIFNIMDRLNND